MNNSSLSPLFRRSVGFDRINDLFDYAMQAVIPNYPHYNIEKMGGNDYRISVATSGFNEDNLNISLENQILTVTGKIEEESSNTTVEFLHRGIYQRSFKLSLRLDEDIEAQQANYENGLLTINLQRNVAEEATPRQIPIEHKPSRHKLLDEPKPE